MFRGPWQVNPTVVCNEEGTVAFRHRDLETTTQERTPQAQDIILTLHVAGVPLGMFANPDFNAWVVQGMLHASPWPWPPTKQPPLFLLSVYCCNGKPRPHDLLRPICEQVTALRNKRNVHIRAVLANSEAHSLVKETVAHSTYFGCPKCIMKGQWCSQFEQVSYTNGDTPEPNHSKYESPLRTHAEFMAGAYDGTHRVAEVTHMFPLQDLDINMIDDVLVGDERHLLHLGAVNTFFTTFTEGGYNVPKMDNDNFNILKLILCKMKFPHERNHGELEKDIPMWPPHTWAYILDVAGYVALQASLNEDDFKMYCYLHWGVAICKRTCNEEYMDYARLLLTKFVKTWGERVGCVPYCVHSLLHLVKEVREKGPLPVNSTDKAEGALDSLQHDVDTVDIVRASKQIVDAFLLREHAFIPLPLTSPIVTNDGHRVILRQNFLLRSEGISRYDKDSWFLATGNQVIKFEKAEKRGIDCTVILGRPLKTPATLSFEHPFPVPDGMNAFTSDKVEGTLELSEEQKEYPSSEIVCKLAVIHMTLFTTFMPLVESFANEA